MIYDENWRTIVLSLIGIILLLLGIFFFSLVGINKSQYENKLFLTIVSIAGVGLSGMFLLVCLLVIVGRFGAFLLSL